MELTESQEEVLKDWIGEGHGLGDIQKLIKEEWGITATYMEVRFLIDDLGIEMGRKERGKSKDALEEVSVVEVSKLLEEQTAVSGGEVKVVVDAVTRPGALASGSVTFSDGETATWQLDQFGRIGLSPSKEGYQPEQEDLQEFQKALQAEIQRAGL